MAIVTLTQHENEGKRSARQAGAISATAAEFIAAVSAELREYFAGTSVEGLVELESRSIAAFAFGRLQDAQEKARNLISDSRNEQPPQPPHPLGGHDPGTP